MRPTTTTTTSEALPIGGDTYQGGEAGGLCGDVAMVPTPNSSTPSLLHPRGGVLLAERGFGTARKGGSGVCWTEICAIFSPLFCASRRLAALAYEEVIVHAAWQ